MKKFITLLFGSLFTLSYQTPSIGCLFFPHQEEYRFFIMQPTVSGRNELSTFYFTTEYFNYENLLNSRAEEANLDEWSTYFNKKYSKECIKKIIYAANIHCISTSTCLDTLLLDCQLLKKEFTQNKATAAYLNYMHKCILYLNDYKDPWGESNHTNITVYSRLKNEGKELLKTFVNNPFLQKRTAYNLLRLYYYSGDKTSIKETYTTYFSSTTQNSMIDGSAFFYYSGYTVANNTNGEFDYIMSKAFDVSIEKRKRSLELFSRKNIDLTLKHAKNNHEKAVIWSMWLLQHPGKGLNTLEKIYTYETDFEEFDILLSREINKLEDWILTPKAYSVAPASDRLRDGYDTYFSKNENEFNHNYINLVNRSNDVDYTKKVIQFVKKLQRSNFKKQELLNLYLTHLYMLLGEYEMAYTYHKKLIKSPIIHQNQTYALQADINGIVLHFAKQKQMTDEGATLLYNFHKKIATNKTINLKRIEKNLLLFIGAQLTEYGEIGWASLLINKAFDYDEHEDEWNYYSTFILGNYHNAEQYLAMNGRKNDFETVFSLLKKKKPTPFEKYIITDEYKNNWWGNDTVYYYPLNFSKDKVMDYRARLKVRADSLPTALAYLKAIDNRHWQQYPHSDYHSHNPFVFNDGFSDNTVGYNFKEVIEEAIHLKNQLKQKEAKKDSLYLLLGNFYFNITVHGNYWIAQNFWRDNEEYPLTKTLKNITPFNKQYYGCTRALYWYEKAIATTKDNELLSVALIKAKNCRDNYLITTQTATQKNYAKNNHFYKKMLEKRLDISGSEYEELVGSCDYWQRYFIKLNNNYKKTTY